MSKTKISAKNQNLLWAISGGRCQYDGCNKLLHTDILTKKKYNSAYIAHIVADSPSGPRGDRERSPKLCDDISNLMLLCDSHHRLVDKEDIIGHTEDRLLDMKRRHEERIERLTSIAPNMSSEIILYGANIGTHNPFLSFNQAVEAISDKYYPNSNQAIELGVKNSLFADNSELYWKSEEANLIDQFNLKIKPKLMVGDNIHYSLLALAPQPLLVKLGTLMNDIADVRVYQKHREPATWSWLNYGLNVQFILNTPVDKTKMPVLVLSLSANINYNRIYSVLGINVSIWELTITEPNNDFMKTETTLSEFKSQVRSVLNKIKLEHGCVELHIFPAMPVSASVEFGRVWMPKADMPLVIYDENKKEDGFYKTIKID